MRESIELGGTSETMPRGTAEARWPKWTLLAIILVVYIVALFLPVLERRFYMHDFQESSLKILRPTGVITGFEAFHYARDWSPVGPSPVRLVWMANMWLWLGLAIVGLGAYRTASAVGLVGLGFVFVPLAVMDENLAEYLVGFWLWVWSLVLLVVGSALLHHHRSALVRSKIPGVPPGAGEGNQLSTSLGRRGPIVGDRVRRRGRRRRFRAIREGGGVDEHVQSPMPSRCCAWSSGRPES